MVLGTVGFVKGDRGLGIAAIIVGMLGFVIGLIVGVVRLSVMNQT
jgi:type III secretory pathway component EscV